jgi:ribonuclease BN (tRNA processing enzyme)
MRFHTSTTGGDVFFSADSGLTSTLIELARSAGLGLVEATVLDERSLEEPAGHLSGKQAGVLARRAGLGRLVLTHYYRPIAERLQADAREAFGGDVELAEEGKRYVV